MRALLYAIAILTSAGCVSLLPETKPPSPRYTIEAAEAPEGDVDTRDWSLVVDDPRTTRVYDSVRMAVITSPGKIEYFPEAEWADRAPKLFATALIQTLQDHGSILAVGDRNAVPVGDLVLQTEIRKAALNVHVADPEIQIVVFARLTNGKGKVYAARKFTANNPVGRETPDGVAGSFNNAFGAIISELTDWAIAQGDLAASGA